MPPRGLPLPRLRELRLRALLTQAQLGERAGLTRPTVGRLEAGDPATPTSIKKLARALRVSPEVLMGPPSEALGEAMVAEERATYRVSRRGAGKGEGLAA